MPESTQKQIAITEKVFEQLGKRLESAKGNPNVVYWQINEALRLTVANPTTLLTGRLLSYWLKLIGGYIDADRWYTGAVDTIEMEWGLFIVNQLLSLQLCAQASHSRNQREYLDTLATSLSIDIKGAAKKDAKVHQETQRVIERSKGQQVKEKTGRFLK